MLKEPALVIKKTIYFWSSLITKMLCYILYLHLFLHIPAISLFNCIWNSWISLDYISFILTENIYVSQCLRLSIINYRHKKKSSEILLIFKSHLSQIPNYTFTPLFQAPGDCYMLQRVMSYLSYLLCLVVYVYNWSCWKEAKKFSILAFKNIEI